MKGPDGHVLDSTEAHEAGRKIFDIKVLPNVSVAVEKLRGVYLNWLIAALFGVSSVLCMAAWRAGLPVLWLLGLSLLQVRTIYFLKKRIQVWEPKPKRLARMIERHDPGLDGRLNAAVEQAAKNGRFDYLQRRLFGEVWRIAEAGSWQRCVPLWLRFLSSLAGVLGVLALLVSAGVWLLVASPAKVGGRPLTWSGLISDRVEVVPGNVEVERGTRLTVSGRFKRPESRVDLVFKDASGSTGRLPMLQGSTEPLYGVSIESLDSSLDYWIETASGSSDHYQAHVYERPKLVAANVVVRYPAQHQPRERAFEDVRLLNVPEGSDIDFEFTFNKPLRAARIVGKDTPVEVLDVSPGSSAENQARWRIEGIRASRVMKLETEDREGHKARENPEFRIEVTANQPPSIRPFLPRHDSRFTRIEEVDFEAEVWDDTWLRRWGMTMQMGQGEPEEFVLGSGGKGGQKQLLVRRLALESQRLEVGDSVSWFFWAEDLAGDGAVRRVESELMLGRIRAFEEEYRQGEESEEEGKSGPQVLELQKQVIAATWNLHRRGNEATGGDQGRKALNVVQQSEAKVAEMVEKAAAKEEDPLKQGIYKEAREHLDKAIAALASSAKHGDGLDGALKEERAAYGALTRLSPAAYNMVRSKKEGASEAQEKTLQMSNLEFAKQEDRYANKTEASSEKENKERNEMEDLLAQLRALARRQEEIVERMRELETRAQSGVDAKEREAAKRELKRLADEQRALARELEESQQKAAEKHEALSAQRDQIEAARVAAQKAAAAMEKGANDEARAAAQRVSENLHQSTDALRQELSGRTREAARELEEQARELLLEEKKISEALNPSGKPHKNLTQNDLGKETASQGARLKRLQQNIQELAVRSEMSEPVFSKALLDAHRSTFQNQTEMKLKAVGEAVARGQSEVARRAESAVSKDIEALAKNLESAANEVMGEEAEALRQARTVLDAMEKALSGRSLTEPAAMEPQARAGEPGSDKADEKNPPAAPGAQISSASGNVKSNSNSQNGSDSSLEGNGLKRPGNGAVVKKDGLTKQGEEPNKIAVSGEAEKPADGVRGAEAGRGGDPRHGKGSVSGGGAVSAQEIGAWMDQLDRVESLLERPQLRAGVARIQQVAEGIRSDMRRNATKPSRQQVEQRMLSPLEQLRDAISSELARREGRESEVPLDRDLVPRRFEEPVRRYYEALGGAR